MVFVFTPWVALNRSSPRKVLSLRKVARMASATVDSVMARRLIAGIEVLSR